MVCPLPKRLIFEKYFCSRNHTGNCTILENCVHLSLFCPQAYGLRFSHRTNPTLTRQAVLTDCRRCIGTVTFLCTPSGVQALVAQRHNTANTHAVGVRADNLSPCPVGTMFAVRIPSTVFCWHFLLLSKSKNEISCKKDRLMYRPRTSSR